MKILVLANQKGGVGKSAIATQLAHYGRSLGLSVLVIDLDHQQNTSEPLRKNRQTVVAGFTASALFEADEPLELAATPLTLIPGDDRLCALERQADRHSRFATRFRAALKRTTPFDLCLVDTNPNPDIRCAAALISADYVLSPVQLNQEAIAGIAGLLGHTRYGIGRIQATFNPTLSFLGILPNLVEATPFQRANFKALATQFGNRLLSCGHAGERRLAYIPRRSSIAEAQAAGLFVPDLGKTSARETWSELKPVFDMILTAMGLAPAEAAAS